MVNAELDNEFQYIYIYIYIPLGEKRKKRATSFLIKATCLIIINRKELYKGMTRSCVPLEGAKESHIAHVLAHLSRNKPKKANWKVLEFQYSMLSR